VGMVYGKYGGYGIDPGKDNCRIHLINSTLRIAGDVILYPGCRIIGNNAEIIIRNGTRINSPSYIIAEKKIEIGENCLISFNVTIRDNDGHKHSWGDESPAYRNREVTIQNNCWIGQDVLILKGVTLGKGSMVSAGSVITKDVPENSLAGNHSVILRSNINWEE
jgi:acetyltransferase-like isoleucine patch superfamily enzyme